MPSGFVPCRGFLGRVGSLAWEAGRAGGLSGAISDWRGAISLGSPSTLRTHRQRGAMATPSPSDPSPPEANHYELLRVSESATPQQLRSAFRSLSKLYHPDTTSLPQAQAAQSFQRLQQAYAVLSDPVARRAYDLQAHGAEATQGPSLRDSPSWGNGLSRRCLQQESRPFGIVQQARGSPLQPINRLHLGEAGSFRWGVVRPAAPGHRPGAEPRPGHRSGLGAGRN
jgi:hypothetical protein